MTEPENSRDGPFYDKLGQVLNIHWHLMETLVREGRLEFPQTENYSLRAQGIAPRRKAAILARWMNQSMSQARFLLFRPERLEGQARGIASGDYVAELLRETQARGAEANTDKFNPFSLEARMIGAIDAVTSATGNALTEGYDNDEPFNLMRHLALAAQIRPTEFKRLAEAITRIDINDPTTISRLAEEKLEDLGYGKRIGCPSFRRPGKETRAYLIAAGVPEEGMVHSPGILYAIRAEKAAEDHIGRLPRKRLPK